MKKLIVIINLISTCAFAQQMSAQIVLIGLLQQGADAQTGSTLSTPVWNTLGNYGIAGGSAGDFAQIYLTEPNAGYNAPFLNSGDDTGIALSLMPGTYQFYFFCDALTENSPGPPNDPGTYGLNLFFGGNNIHSGIAAYSPKNIVTATPVQSGQNTLTLNGDEFTPVAASGNLSYTADGLSVTLTSYGYGQPGVFGGPPLDRVSNRNNVPDGYLDAVGTFDLVITPVPEPASVAIFIVAVLPIFIARPQRLHRLCKYFLPN